MLSFYFNEEYYMTRRHFKRNWLIKFNVSSKYCIKELYNERFINNTFQMFKALNKIQIIGDLTPRIKINISVRKEMLL